MSDAAGLTVTVEPAGPEPPGPQRPTRRRLPRWLITLVIVVALGAAGLGGGAYYYWATVELSELPRLSGTTTVYYSDGQTVLARLGDSDLTVLPYEQILPAVIDVTVAAEDPEFWSNTGGPIARAVVRHAFDIVDTGRNAQLRIWVLARKLEATYSKQEILAWYLNAVPFGRMAYGIEAAARAYFGKSARTTASSGQQLTHAEAMVLLALVRQPYATETEPGFDPSAGGQAEANSRQRWAEIRDSLAALAGSGQAPSLSASTVAALTYPAVRPPAAGPTELQEPIGLVAGHVLAELTHTPGSPFEGWSWDAVRNGGYQITTTIDVRAQKVLQIAVDPESPNSPLHGQPRNLQAAGVVVQPGTGRVLAYYGGPDGTGTDFAGVRRDADGSMVGFGAHPPGSSFMVYTLAAALKQGMTLDSQWQWTPHEQLGRHPDNPVRNHGVCVGSRDGRSCSLHFSVVYQLNVPLYDVTVGIGVAPVLTMAHDLGITSMWTDEHDRVRLTPAEIAIAANTGRFGYEVGIGQYPVTVLDQAGAMATLAGRGMPAPTHFVRTVTKDGQVLYEEPAPTGETVLWAQELNDVNKVLTTISGRDDLALITGNWGFIPDLGNTDVWSIGYTSTAAAAIWIGNVSEIEGRPLVDINGMPVWGSGLPTEILLQVLDETPTISPT